MKRNTLLLFFISFSFTVTAQQKSITQGYLEYKIKYPTKTGLDSDTPPPPPPPPGMEYFSDNGSGPTAEEGYEIKIWFTPDFEKAMNEVSGRSTFIYNTQNKTTVSLKEITGLKVGTVATAADEEVINNYLDSLYGRKKLPLNIPPVIEYTNDTKKIAGFECKKAFMITGDQNTKKDTVTVWYYPGYKLSNDFIFYTDRLEHRKKLTNLNLINGMPLSIQLKLTSKTSLEIELIKIDINKTIADKEFTVPKGFELKSIKEHYGLQ